tara:strand:- start:2628 stop:2918 length:291 start_codon:yes stop_codon:yes gene_type:complete
MYQINEIGKEQIRQQLIEKLKDNGYNFQGDEFIGTRQQNTMLRLWSEDIEQAIDTHVFFFENEDPSGAEVELHKFDTISGNTEFISINNDGVDWTE